MGPGFYVLLGGISAIVLFIVVWDLIAERVNRKARQNKS